MAAAAAAGLASSAVECILVVVVVAHPELERCIVGSANAVAAGFAILRDDDDPPVLRQRASICISISIGGQRLFIVCGKSDGKLFTPIL